MIDGQPGGLCGWGLSWRWSEVIWEWVVWGDMIREWRERERVERRTRIGGRKRDDEESSDEWKQEIELVDQIHQKDGWPEMRVKTELEDVWRGCEGGWIARKKSQRVEAKTTIGWFWNIRLDVRDSKVESKLRKNEVKTWFGENEKGWRGERDLL